jgi:hypothetical protein
MLKNMGGKFFPTAVSFLTDMHIRNDNHGNLA